MSDRSERQKKCVDNWVKAGCKASVVASCGFGKTRIGIQAIKRFLTKNPGKKVLVIAPNDVIKRQWEEQIDVEVRTMFDCARHEYQCDMLVIDECHMVMAPTLSKIFSNVKYKIILCLTATFERLDGRDKILSKYAPVCDEVTVEEAINNGWLAPYKEYLVLIEPKDIGIYQEYNRQFLYYFSYFNYDFSLAMKLATNTTERTKYARRIMGRRDYKEVLKEVTINAIGFSRSLQKRKQYVNNHPRKIELTNLILEHRQDRKCITFSSTIKMAEKIKYGKVYSSKETNKHNRQTLDEFIKQDTGVLNSSMKLSTGFNDPKVSVMVVLGTNSSKTIKSQRRGRVLREAEGKQAEVFNLVLKDTVEYKWAINSMGKGSYITISEDQLLDLLEGKKVRAKKNKEIDTTFRF